MLTHTRYSPGDPRSRELAVAFGLDVIVADGDLEVAAAGDAVGEPGDADEAEGKPGDADDEDPPRGKLREVATRAGIPAITPELAHSRAIVEDSVERGVHGVENVLRAVGVLDGSGLEADARPGTDPIHAAEMTRVFVGESGMFRAAALDVGDRVSADTTVGEVYDPSSYEVLETVRAGRDGMLLALKQGLATIEGESVATVVGID